MLRVSTQSISDDKSTRPEWALELRDVSGFRLNYYLHASRPYCVPKVGTVHETTITTAVLCTIAAFALWFFDVPLWKLVVALLSLFPFALFSHWSNRCLGSVFIYFLGAREPFPAIGTVQRDQTVLVVRILSLPLRERLEKYGKNWTGSNVDLLRNGPAPRVQDVRFLDDLRSLLRLGIRLQIDAQDSGKFASILATIVFTARILGPQIRAYLFLISLSVLLWSIGKSELKVALGAIGILWAIHALVTYRTTIHMLGQMEETNPVHPRPFGHAPVFLYRSVVERPQWEELSPSHSWRLRIVEWGMDAEKVAQAILAILLMILLTWLALFEASSDPSFIGIFLLP